MVLQVTAWQDTDGHLHRTKEQAEAASLRKFAEDFVRYSPPPLHASAFDVIRWLMHRAKDLPLLAQQLNPKETP